MATAWTGVALTRLVALLQADARLSLYVDAVTLQVKIRDDAAPNFTRHAIEVAPGPLSSVARTTQSNDETFAIRLRLWMRCWTATPATLLYANDTSGGLGSGGTGGSSVGLLQFIEDVGNCVRKTHLPSGAGAELVMETALEMAGFDDIAFRSLGDRDRAFLTHDLTVSLVRDGYHDPALRTPA